MKIYDFEQRSPQWYAIRCGLPTASNFEKIITSDGTPSKQRQKYLYMLAAEKVTGVAEESYQNSFMQRGIDIEDEARDFYSLVTDNEISKVGFCMADHGKYGCSPDGFIGEDGSIEIKCPISSTHVGYLLRDGLFLDYFQQIQGQLLITGRHWADLISYYPGMKPFITRVERDERFLKCLKIELEVFCENLYETVTKIT